MVEEEVFFKEIFDKWELIIVPIRTPRVYRHLRVKKPRYHSNKILVEIYNKKFQVVAINCWKADGRYDKRKLNRGLNQLPTNVDIALVEFNQEPFLKTIIENQPPDNVTLIIPPTTSTIKKLKNKGYLNHRPYRLLM